MDSTTGTKHGDERGYEVDRATGHVKLGEGRRGRRPVRGTTPSVEGACSKAPDGPCGPLPVFERNHYFLGQLLTADDFQAEQEYHTGKRRLLNRLLYGVGVLCGLLVQQGTGRRLTITAGVAIDGCGREIVVPHDVTIDLTEHLSPRKGATTANVWLHYAEFCVDPVPAMGRADDDAEAKAYRRVRESHRIAVEWDRLKAKTSDGERPPRGRLHTRLKAGEDRGVLLARVRVRAKEGTWVIQTLDETPRKTVASHAQLVEALRDVRKQLEVLQRQKVTCPQCGHEVDRSRAR